MHCEEIFYRNPNLVYSDGNLQNRSSCCSSSSSSRSSCSSSSCLPMLPSSDCEGKRFPCRDLTGGSNAIQAIREEKMNSELTSKLPLPSSKCSMSFLSCSRHRMRQNLTEAEKEVWRMRRVLANRESARQTIIRRQARRDGLSKKITELSLNNRNMKMEREHVMKEYMWLKRKNKQLKDELAMAIEYKVKCRETCSAFIPTVCSPWPVISAPLYVLPYSWFFPLLYQKCMILAILHLTNGKTER